MNFDGTKLSVDSPGTEGSAMSPATCPCTKGLTQFVAHIVTCLRHQTGIWRLPAIHPIRFGGVPELVWRLAEKPYEGQ